MNSYSCFAFILTRGIGTSPRAGYPASVRENTRPVVGDRTENRVDDLAVRPACATLLDLGVVDLEEVVEPCNEL